MAIVVGAGTLRLNGAFGIEVNDHDAGRNAIRNAADVPDMPAGPRERSIEISVVSAASGKPITSFRVLAGTPYPSVMADEIAKRSGGDPTDTAQWQPHTLLIGANGKLDWPSSRNWPELVLRIEADGYQTQRSAWIKKGSEPARLEFRMVQDWGVWGRVLDPDGKPAAKATVAMAIQPQYVAIHKGRIVGVDPRPPKNKVDRWRRPTVTETDADGRFALPFEFDAAARVLIAHDSGVCKLPYAKFQQQPEITLPKWGRVEIAVSAADAADAGK